MEIAQFYETLLIDRETGLEAQLGVAPASLVSEPISPDLLGSLGLTVIDGFPPSFLPHAIAAGLASESADAARAFIEQLANSPRSLYSEAPFIESRNLLEFAHHVAFANVIPIEESPLDTTSLAALATKATGVGAGVAVGFAIAGPTPLLIVTVPFGIFICTAAAEAGPEAGRAIGEAIGALVRRWASHRAAAEERGN
jgi:hypothetical protein